MPSSGTRFHQLRELLKTFFGERDVLVEIDQYAEHLLEVRIGVLQRVIELTRADDDDFQLQRNDLRVEGDGRDAAEIPSGDSIFNWRECRARLSASQTKGSLSSFSASTTR